MALTTVDSGLISSGAITLTTQVTGTLPVANGGTGVTTSTGSGANVLGTSPTITGATITVASTAAPCFSAYQSSAQTLGTSATKISFQTEEYDTASAFDSTTNYRFTPQVTGYYTVNAAIQMSSSFTTGNLSIYKNGSAFKNGFSTGTSGVTGIFTVACQVYLNGSTDYIECYGTIGTGQALVASSITTYFQAAMIRSA